MQCPDCGVEMNHHANKIDETDVLDKPEGTDANLSVVIEEAHTCPHCGQTIVRKRPLELSPTPLNSP